VKEPEVTRTTMQRQGVSTTTPRENSLLLHGKGNMLAARSSE